MSGIGQGSAEGFTRNSPNATLGVNHLIGTRIIRSGRVTLDGAGSGTVTFPEVLPGVIADYLVFLQGLSATVTRPSAETVSGFSITGGVADVVNWEVVKATGSSTAANDLPPPN